MYTCCCDHTTRYPYILRMLPTKLWWLSPPMLQLWSEHKNNSFDQYWMGFFGFYTFKLKFILGIAYKLFTWFFPWSILRRNNSSICITDDVSPIQRTLLTPEVIAYIWGFVVDSSILRLKFNTESWLCMMFIYVYIPHKYAVQNPRKSQHTQLAALFLRL